MALNKNESDVYDGLRLRFLLAPLLKRRSLNFTHFTIWATCNSNLRKIYSQKYKINID
ncbi:hypothetical protein [Nostoc favosum]|uniref:Uncharacterized protein n=1 Tax=Nostoc favosum CHAB5714 TaxID=2780399 RepID=A0ABS8IF95_9NOSO|nr:hypothetical protein [Nostoc favosum]MCC5602920.1 hypothetical protein [Nostoc favosum CHAB5714]